MLVYGDQRETADPQEQLERIAEQLSVVRRMPPGIERHAKLVGALIEAGQVLQGVADLDAPPEPLNMFVHQLARAVVRCWDSGFSEVGDLPDIPAMNLPRWVELRLPEGFAFYAVYPEAYIEAARRLRLSGPPRVIGIRSIGTTLGAVVAAALDAPAAVTVRPFGDPFARQVELPPELVEADAHYVIVDEGPGLSGSSFGAVADWLEERGVPLDRIAFLPSHSGDLGPHASASHRTRWNRAQRIATEFQPNFLRKLFGPLEEFSTGDPWERRKYLATTNGTRVLIKFAGLGAVGERKLKMARTLHAAGFTPEPIGLVHGFLVERWCEDARPLRSGENPVEAIARYLLARQRLFPAEEESGASIGELLTMCRRNISLALGEDACRALDGIDAQALQKRVRRIRTDNKLDRGEWLRTPDGHLLKADAVDHHQAHDLIGCQDIAWDIAGAITEFDLNDVEAATLIASLAIPVDRELLEFNRIAYASFRLGRAAMPGETPAEQHRYRRWLHLLLDQHVCPETRQESLVD